MTPAPLGAATFGQVRGPDGASRVVPDGVVAGAVSRGRDRVAQGRGGGLGTGDRQAREGPAAGRGRPGGRGWRGHEAAPEATPQAAQRPADPAGGAGGHGVKTDVAAKVSRLREEIRRHEHLYYVLASPEISDYEFDRLMAELRALEEAHPELAAEDSPTRRVGGEPVSELPQVAPRHPDAVARQLVQRGRARGVVRAGRAGAGARSGRAGGRGQDRRGVAVADLPRWPPRQRGDARQRRGGRRGDVQRADDPRGAAPAARRAARGHGPR